MDEIKGGQATAWIYSMDREVPKKLMMELIHQATEQNYKELMDCEGNELKLRLYCKQRAYDRVLATLLGHELKMLAIKAELLYECITAG